MKNKTILTMAAILLHFLLTAQTNGQIRRCATQQMHEGMIDNDPSWTMKFADQRASRQAAADYYQQCRAKENHAAKQLLYRLSPCCP